MAWRYYWLELEQEFSMAQIPTCETRYACVALFGQQLR